MAKVLYDATHLRGFVYAHQGKLLIARDALLEALQIATDLSYERGIAVTARELATNASQRSAGDEAQQYIAMAINYYRRIGDRFNLEAARSDLAGILKEAKAYEQAITVGEEALLYFKQTQSSDWIATLQVSLAEAFLETGDWVKSREYALSVYQSEIPYLQPYAMYTLGCLDSRQGKGEQAESVWQQGAIIASKSGDNYILAHLNHQISLFYKDSGDDSQYLLYHQRVQDSGVSIT